jgi:hypothetical protein
VHPPHGVGTITYHADHTSTLKEYSEEGASFAHGTWRLRGRELITRFGKDIVVREIVLSISANQFRTRAPDGQVFIYTRVKPERPSAPRLNFVVQHLLGLKKALIGCFVGMSFSWSVVEMFGD